MRVVVVLVIYASPSDPMCLRCLILTLLCHVEMFLLSCIASWTSGVVSVIVIVGSLCVFLSMCRFVL